MKVCEESTFVASSCFQELGNALCCKFEGFTGFVSLLSNFLPRCGSLCNFLVDLESVTFEISSVKCKIILGH
jgi:hypothetical protein